MIPEDIINEVRIKWIEYLEMAEDPSAMLTQILANMLILERQKNEQKEKIIRQHERILRNDF